MENVNIIEQSKVSWNVEAVNQDGYPGDTNIKLGCLQRIANAAEAMAQNHQRLINDLEWYKKRYAEQRATIDRLYKSNAALRGHFKRLKKQTKS